MKPSHIPLFLLLSMSLTGCNTPGPWNVWISTASSTPTDGPLNVGGVRAPVLTKNKIVINPYDNHYTYAFTDSAGRKINVFDSLLIDLDTYVEKITELKPWITKPGTKEFRQGQAYPFKMFLLTISPEVILVVPYQDKWQVDACNTLFLQGCLQSQTLRGSAYWFRGAPKVAEGSYWFSSNEGSGKTHQLDDSIDVTEIKVGNAILRLKQINGEWQVERIQ